MSTSETSFSFCFCRFDIIEKAMSRVSSGESRGASTTGCNSPPMRITGKQPAFRCRSEATWAIAVIRKSSILTGIDILAETVQGRRLEKLEREKGKNRSVQIRSANNAGGKTSNIILGRSNGRQRF